MVCGEAAFPRAATTQSPSVTGIPTWQ